MRIIPRLGTLLHLLRAGLLSGIALQVVGTLMMAAEYQQSRRSQTAQVESVSPADSAVSDGAGTPDRKAHRLRRQVFQMAVLGALVGVFTALLLMLFPVGPASKVIFGIVCGPVLPMLLFVPTTSSADDVGGMILLGALVGLLVGLLEANRVGRNRRLPQTADL